MATLPARSDGIVHWPTGHIFIADCNHCTQNDQGLMPCVAGRSGSVCVMVGVADSPGHRPGGSPCPGTAVGTGHAPSCLSCRCSGLAFPPAGGKQATARQRPRRQLSFELLQGSAPLVIAQSQAVGFPGTELNPGQGPAPVRNPARFIAILPRPLAAGSLTSWPPAKPITGMPHSRDSHRRSSGHRTDRWNCPSACPSRTGKSPIRCANYASELGGAMGIRTPDLLHAMNTTPSP
jgi:hypothetical protein